MPKLRSIPGREQSVPAPTRARPRHLSSTGTRQAVIKQARHDATLDLIHLVLLSYLRSTPRQEEELSIQW